MRPSLVLCGFRFRFRSKNEFLEWLRGIDPLPATPKSSKRVGPELVLVLGRGGRAQAQASLVFLVVRPAQIIRVFWQCVACARTLATNRGPSLRLVSSRLVREEFVGLRDLGKAGGAFLQRDRHTGQRWVCVIRGGGVAVAVAVAVVRR